LLLLGGQVLLRLLLDVGVHVAAPLGGTGA